MLHKILCSISCGESVSPSNNILYVAFLDPIVQVDLGPARDPWVELYGNSVLNNTLHDRLDRHKLQKSQSAVWTRNNEA